MIISISVENFLSIKEKITLDLEATTSKKLINNTFYYNEKDRLLKNIIIYGANASGKTNLIKAIDFMKAMIIKSHTHNVGDTILITPFKLDKKYENKPTKFEIKFIHQNIKYDYSFSFTKEKIIDEILYYYPNNRKSLIFKRKNTNKYEFKIDKSKQDSLYREVTIENTLYLSRATQHGYDKTKPVYEFFLNNLITSFNQQWEVYTIKK